MKLTVCEWMDEMNRLSFHDKRIRFRAKLLSRHQAVRVTLDIACFDSIDPRFADGMTITITRQEIFACHEGEMMVPPEEALHRIWQSMWAHEFKEQLQHDGKPACDPHGLRSELPPIRAEDRELIEAGNDDR